MTIGIAVLSVICLALYYVRRLIVGIDRLLGEPVGEDAGDEVLTAADHRRCDCQH
jgi:hypothetical protein